MIDLTVGRESEAIVIPNQRQKKSKFDNRGDSDDEYLPSELASEVEEEYEENKGPVDVDCLSEKAGGWNKKAAREFQCLLLTIMHFVLGGQRKQVIQNITLQVTPFHLFLLTRLKENLCAPGWYNMDQTKHRKGSETSDQGWSIRSTLCSQAS